MFKDIIKPSIILFLVCAVMTGALAYVNGVTKPIIDENNKIAEQESLRTVYNDADNFLMQKPVKNSRLRKLT